MIKELEIYTVICDKCGADLQAGQEIAGWSELEGALYTAEASGWRVFEDSQVCHNCLEIPADEDQK